MMSFILHFLYEIKSIAVLLSKINKQFDLLEKKNMNEKKFLYKKWLVFPFSLRVLHKTKLQLDVKRTTLCFNSLNSI